MCLPNTLSQTGDDYTHLQLCSARWPHILRRSSKTGWALTALWTHMLYPWSGKQVGAAAQVAPNLVGNVRHQILCHSCQMTAVAASPVAQVPASAVWREGLEGLADF